MYGRLRWLAVVAGVLLIALVEALSDTVLDASLKFPLGTLLVVTVVTVVAVVAASLDFRQIDQLTRDVLARNRELESRNAALRAVYDVSLAVSGRTDPHQTITGILDRARELLNVDVAMLTVEGPTGEVRLVAASAGPGVMRGEDGRDRQIGGSQSGVSAAGILGGSISRANPTSRFLSPGYQVRISEPVLIGDRRAGSLALASRQPRSFSETDTGTLSALATQVALAMDAARLQGELQNVAVQGERERIAREMHDGLAQVLGYVNTKSQAVDELLADGRVPEARRQLNELAGAARSVYVDVREAILALSSPVAPELGLAAALEQYATLFAESSKLVVAFDASPAARSAPLSAVAQAEVFRIAREALTNVRKHARARRVGISLSATNDEVVLLTEDDGIGFDAGQPGDPEVWPHFGLAGMRGRAESIGGRIAWRSRAGHGTAVELRVPVGGVGSVTPPFDLAPFSETTGPIGQHQAVRTGPNSNSEAD